MALYLIGDIQGCDEALERLLTHIAFSPSRDTLYVLGDLVNRGSHNAQMLRRFMAYGSSAQCLLGNHDLHLLAVSRGVRQPNQQDTIQDILTAPDRDALLHWLRHQHLGLQVGHVLMVHAGVLPTWSVEKTLALAAEFETVLRSPQLPEFLHQMYGNQPDRWDDALQGADRLRVVVNALTRLRFCTPDGVMHLKASGAPDQAPPGALPWFEVKQRRTAGTPIACGHWSTLGVRLRPDLLALDSGCVWGGCLSALRLGDRPEAHELIQVKCEASLAPGGD